MEQSDFTHASCFDAAFTNSNILKLKILYQYIPGRLKKFFALFIKLQEIQAIISLPVCKNNQELEFHPESLLEALMPYSNETEINSYKAILNILHNLQEIQSMMELFQMFQELQDVSSENDSGSFDMMQLFELLCSLHTKDE